MKRLDRLELDKLYWFCILRGIIEVFSYVYSKKILYNDLKLNNILFKKRVKNFNLVIIDFGKVRFIFNFKVRMFLFAFV